MKLFGRPNPAPAPQADPPRIETGEVYRPPPKVVVTPACSKCVYSDSAHYAKRVCRKNPPVPGTPSALWPIVFDNDWCGSFTPETP